MKTCLRAGVCIYRTTLLGELGVFCFLPMIDWLLVVKVPGWEGWGRGQGSQPPLHPAHRCCRRMRAINRTAELGFL